MWFLSDANAGGIFVKSSLFSMQKFWIFAKVMMVEIIFIQTVQGIETKEFPTFKQAFQLNTKV